MCTKISLSQGDKENGERRIGKGVVGTLRAASEKYKQSVRASANSDNSDYSDYSNFSDKHNTLYN